MPEPFGVWPENELPIALAMECHWERQIGFGGRDWQGVRTTEIESVLRTHRVATRDRQGLVSKVRLFIAIACAELNSLESERAEEARSN